MSDYQKIILSHATYAGPSGATAAATAAFFSSDYKPPAQDRYIDHDIVKNQNGKFKYLYDNGPGWRKWSPFNLHCERSFETEVGLTATQQYAALVAMWDHPGYLGMQTPDGTYTVHWADNLEKSFRVFPSSSGEEREYIVVVQFEEGA